MTAGWRADLGVKVDANRLAINGLGAPTARRFDQLRNEMRAGFEETGKGFTEMRGELDRTAAGQRQIVELLTGLISGQNDQ